MPLPDQLLRPKSHPFGKSNSITLTEDTLGIFSKRARELGQMGRVRSKIVLKAVDPMEGSASIYTEKRCGLACPASHSRKSSQAQDKGGAIHHGEVKPLLRVLLN